MISSADIQVEANDTATVVRCVSLKVVKPLGCDWKVFGNALSYALRRAARCANVVQGALYLADCRSAQSSPKDVPPKDWPNTYSVAVAAAPELPTSTVSMIDQYVRKKYSSRNSDGLSYRYATFVGAGGIPNYKGIPYPIHRREWIERIRFIGDDQVVSVPLSRKPVEGKTNQQVQRFDVVLGLRGSRGDARHIETMKKVVAGEIDGGEMKIFRKSDGVVMCSFALRLPRRVYQADGTLNIRTSKDELMTAACQGSDRLFIYTGHELKASLAAAKKYQQDLSNDYKFEPRGFRRGSRVPMAERAAKHRRQADAHINRITSYMVNFAKRRGCGIVRYDDSERGYLGTGPYAQIKTLLSQKCERDGLQYFHESK